MCLRRINTLLAKVTLVLIYIYQHTLSPDRGIFSPRLRGRICAHEPHCSEYGRQALTRYGFIPGLPMTLERVSQCLPSQHTHYDPVSYRVVFFGSAPISVPFLEALSNDNRYEVVGVVSMPDEPSGRGMRVQENIIKSTAKKLTDTPSHDTYIQTPRSLRLDSKKYAEEARAFQARIEEINPDICVVVAYGNIIPKRLLDLPHFWCINVHGSLLPAYRGASPLQDIFLHNEAQTGLTIMHMDEGIDTWPMITTLKTDIPFHRTVKDLIAWIRLKWPAFLNDTLREYAKGHLHTTIQDDAHASHCSKITKEDWYIDIYKDSISAVYAKYRAYILRPKVTFTRDRWNNRNIQVIIEDLQLDQNLFAANALSPLIDSTGKLHASITQLIVKPEGKTGMTREDFLHGYSQAHVSWKHLSW